MARRNEVLSLFGATPEQIMAKERREQAAMLLQQQNPYQQVGMAIGMGLGRLFGGESQEVAEARQMQEARQGLNLMTVEGMKSAAQRLQDQGFQEQALELLDLASRKEATELERDLAGRVQVNRTEFVTIQEWDDLNQEYVDKQVKISVPYDYDRKTQTYTPIFSEAQKQDLARTESNMEKSNTAQKEKNAGAPETRIANNIRQELTNLPVGEVYTFKSGPRAGTSVRKVKNAAGEIIFVDAASPVPTPIVPSQPPQPVENPVPAFNENQMRGF